VPQPAWAALAAGGLRLVNGCLLRNAELVQACKRSLHCKNEEWVSAKAFFPNNGTSDATEKSDISPGVISFIHASWNEVAIETIEIAYQGMVINNDGK